MKNINQSTLIRTCRTVCKCVCMDFADVFLTCVAHSICFTVLLWGAGLASLPLAWPSCSLRCISTRFSPLNSFQKHCRGYSAGEALPSLNVWGYKCLSQLLQEHPPFVLLIGHPVRADLHLINDDMEDDLGPAGSHPPAAVNSNHLVQIVHASFVVVVVQDDSWLSVLTITNLSHFVQCAQKDHILVPLWEVRNWSGGGGEGKLWWEGLSPPCCEECRLVLSNCANHGDLSPQELLAEFMWGEDIVTRDIVPLQSICHIKQNPHPLVVLWASTGPPPCVDLHLPSVAGLCVPSHPYLDATLCWLNGHILP